MSMRYIRANGQTFTEMHSNMGRTPLPKFGDCILVWVNEGDFWGAFPTDVEVDAKERAEYERLKTKFES
jgi:hypothetical protein